MWVRNKEFSENLEEIRKLGGVNFFNEEENKICLVIVFYLFFYSYLLLLFLNFYEVLFWGNVGEILMFLNYLFNYVD